MHDPDYPDPCVNRPADYRKAGYLAWHSDADRRIAAGEQQRWCVTCQRCRWESTPCNEPTAWRLGSVEAQAGWIVTMLVQDRGYAWMRARVRAELHDGVGYAWEYFTR